MACKCNSKLLAFGTPDCTLVPENIRRIMFTTDLRALPAVAEPGQTPYADLWPTPVWFYDVPGTATEDLWQSLWKLVTPLIDNVTSERGEAERETIGSTTYFVRYAPRRFECILGRKPAEWGEFIAQLRCQKEVGVFLVDEAGRVWGERAGQYTDPDNSTSYLHAEYVKPIAIVPSSIDERMEFASVSTVPKWIFSFELEREFKDYELVPVWEGKDSLTYQPPIHLVTSLKSVSGTTAEVAIFARFAQGVKAQNLVPFTTVFSPVPHGFDNSNVSLGLTTSWTHLGNGVWSFTFPANSVKIKFTNTQLLGSISPAGFNYYDFEIPLV